MSRGSRSCRRSPWRRAAVGLQNRAAGNSPGILSTTRALAAKRMQFGQIARRGAVEIIGPQGREHARRLLDPPSTPQIGIGSRQRIMLTSAENIMVSCEDVFHQRRSRPRHADDEDRRRIAIAGARANVQPGSIEQRHCRVLECGTGLTGERLKSCDQPMPPAQASNMRSG